MNNNPKMSRKEKLDFLRRFHRYGVIVNNTPKKLAVWVCSTEGLYTCHGLKKVGLAEPEMITYLNSEGQQYKNIIVFVRSAPDEEEPGPGNLYQYEPSEAITKHLKK